MAGGDGFFGNFGEELKKFGKSAASQVTGDDKSKSQPAADTSAVGQLGKLGSSIVGQVTGDSVGPAVGSGDSLDAAGQLGGFGKSIVGQVTGSDTSVTENVPVRTAGGNFWDQIKAFGFSALRQVSGKDLEQMREKDRAQSMAGEAEVKARIQRIYQEHVQRRGQEEHYEEQQEKQIKEQQKELKKQEKKEQMDVTVAQTKASAEKKNMGAE